LIFVFSDALHIHFEGCKKHDIVETYTSEEFKRVVSNEDIQAIFAHNNACQNHSYDMRDAQFSHDNRCKKDYQQHHKEYKCGVCDGKILGDMQHIIAQSYTKKRETQRLPWCKM